MNANVEARSNGSAPPRDGFPRRPPGFGAAVSPEPFIEFGIQVGMWLLGKMIDFVTFLARLYPTPRFP